MCVAFVLLVAPRGWACQSVDAAPMSTASVGTEHSALHFGVRNRIVLLTERDAERCDLVRFDKAKRATRRFQYRLWVAENIYTSLCGACRILGCIVVISTVLFTEWG